MCKSCSNRLSSEKHGTPDNDPTYITWSKMKARCLNPNDKDYDNYGGRGITIYPLWIDSFEAFLMSVGPRPEGHTLDRKDYQGNYEPGNVRWATIAEQNRNTSANVRIEYQGTTKVLAEWIIELGLQDQEAAIRKRISRGMDPLEAMTKEVKSRK